METLVWAWAVASARHSANAAVTGAGRHRSIRMGTLLSQRRSKRVLAISGFEMPVEAWPIRAKCSGIVAACQPTARHVAETRAAAERRRRGRNLNIWPNTIRAGQGVTHWDESSIPPAATCGPICARLWAGFA